jgi:hypothetical protein
MPWDYFYLKKYCGMKIKTWMRLLDESRGNRMAIDLAGVEKILSLERPRSIAPSSTVKGCRA